MKTNLLESFKPMSLVLVMVGVLFAIAIVGPSMARADTGSVVTISVRNSSNVVVTTAALGSVVSASTTVASSTPGVTPTGTVNFNMFANLTCSGTPTTQANVPLINMSAISTTTTVGAAGLSYTDHYNGDATSTPSNSQCVALVPTSSGTTISTGLSTSSVLMGSSVSDSASLLNVTNTASGTVAYTVYTNSACTLGAQSAGTVSVVNKVAPNSNAIFFSTPGTYYWQAVYSGDAQNTGATSTCGSEILNVYATTTPPVVITPTPGTGMVSGVVFNDLNKDHLLTIGEPGIAGFVINLHKGNKNKSPIVASTTTDANGAYAFNNLGFGTYYIEEINQPGWKQTTHDMKVKLSSSTVSSVMNFSNIIKSATTTKKGRGNAYGHELNHGQIIKALVHADKDNNGKGSKGESDDNGKGKGKAKGKNK